MPRGGGPQTKPTTYAPKTYETRAQPPTQNYNAGGLNSNFESTG